MEEYRKMARAKKIKKDEINNAEFFAALKAMEEELQTFRTKEGQPYRLLPLPSLVS